MHIKPDQLAAVLQKKLAPIYFISGDEPLQREEAADAVRKAARLAGYLQREVLTVSMKGFSWQSLQVAADSLSIFADNKVIDLRLAQPTVGNEGAKALLAYCQSAPPDTLLLLTSPKLPKESLKTRWVQALDKAGVLVQVWPLEGQDFVSWLQGRLRQRGLTTDQEGLGILVSRVEGNLLAAAQEIEKLYVLYGEGRLSAPQIIAAVVDSSRYDVFKLMDCVLAAEVNRIVKIWHALQAEGVAATIVLWAITRDARLLIKIKRATASGQSLDAVYQANQVWGARKLVISTAHKRLSLAVLHQVLVLAAKADRQIKGQQFGDCWETMLSLCLLLASIPTLGRLPA
ncbi:MAG: DNA polymerase III subunit delta [Methylococcaceae bacterium]|jgi:DNA polymerase-3 subunit delta|nr:MAG: DNA polymerase III subunit delta [Methylococcaceae bacterium]